MSEMSNEMLLGMLILVMLAAYAGMFVWRAFFTGESTSFRTRMGMAKDSSYVTVALNKHHNEAEARQEVEDHMEAEREAFEHQQETGETVYPEHLDKKERMQKDPHVEQEKETTYPEIPRDLKK